MLQSIHIQGFKSFQDTKIDSLRKVNLVLGGQNVGKTSLLEAVYLGASVEIAISRLSSIFRLTEGNDKERFIDAVFKGKKMLFKLTSSNLICFSTWINSRPINIISGKGIEKNSSQSGMEVFRNIEFLYSNDLNINSNPAYDRTIGKGFLEQAAMLEFSNSLSVSIHLPNQINVAQLFDKVVMSRKKKRLLEMLRGIEPRLEDMHALTPDGETRLYVELDGHANALPLPQLGHGFSRLVNLYCNLLATESKLALVDEIENGIHYSALPTLFKGIQDIAANYEVQSIMTTHSWDCIRAAYKTFADANALKDFQLIRLERDQDNVRAILINDEALDTVMEAGYEVR